jgi:hypothetical protein
VNGRLIERARLTAGERRAMRALMDRYFLGVTPAVFTRDLAGKDYAILLTGAGGELCGFTTLAVVPVRVAGEELTVVYSGDTIVDRGARGSFALAATWVDSIRRLRAARGGGRMAWLLICSSPRTYRFLPLFFREFHPCAGRASPPTVRRRIDALAGARYGNAYDPATGVVRLPDPQPLRPEQCPVDEEAGRDEHDRFFLRANPGWRRGDELACFTELGDDNLTAAGRRMVVAGERSHRDAGVNSGFEEIGPAPPAGGANGRPVGADEIGAARPAGGANGRPAGADEIGAAPPAGGANGRPAGAAPAPGPALVAAAGSGTVSAPAPMPALAAGRRAGAGGGR